MKGVKAGLWTTLWIFVLGLGPLSAETLLRPDSSAIHYYLNEPESESYPLIAILQGSECLRVSDKT